VSTEIWHIWQKHTEKNHPLSRDLASVIAGDEFNINANTAQLILFLYNFDNCVRQLGMGSRKMTLFSSVHPDAPMMSQIFQLWARNSGHIKDTCESGSLTKELCK
jgi:hypothetical protein